MTRSFLKSTTSVALCLGLAVPMPIHAQDTPAAEVGSCIDSPIPPCIMPDGTLIGEGQELPGSDEEASDEAPAEDPAQEMAPEEVQPDAEPSDEQPEEADPAPEPEAVAPAPVEPQTDAESESAPEVEQAPQDDAAEPAPDVAEDTEEPVEAEAESEEAEPEAEAPPAAEQPEEAAQEQPAPQDDAATTTEPTPDASTGSASGESAAETEAAEAEAEAETETLAPAAGEMTAETLDQLVDESVRARREAESAAAAAQADAPAAAAAAEADGESETEVVTETVTDESARSSAEEFMTTVTGAQTSADADAEAAAEADPEAKEKAKSRSGGLSDFEKVLLFGLGAVAVGTILNNGDKVVSNSGDRVVVERDGNLYVMKNDDTLLRQPGNEVRTETFNDGSTRTTVARQDGSQIVTIRDANGRVLRRARVATDGTSVLLFDDTQQYEAVDVTTLPDIRYDDQRSEGMDQEALRTALAAASGQEFDRRFSLNQIRNISAVRNLVPEITLNSITFATGSAAITPSQAEELAELGEALVALIQENPAEVFMIEGHTDAVGSASMNLALSDRRAETVALALTEYFDVPPENMIVQGYGETYLKVRTLTAERENRRAAVRRITPLLDQRVARSE